MIKPIQIDSDSNSNNVNNIDCHQSESNRIYLLKYKIYCFIFFATSKHILHFDTFKGRSMVRPKTYLFNVHNIYDGKILCERKKRQHNSIKGISFSYVLILYFSFLVRYSINIYFNNVIVNFFLFICFADANCIFKKRKETVGICCAIKKSI